jgi:hypothetical protein
MERGDVRFEMFLRCVWIMYVSSVFVFVGCRITWLYIYILLALGMKIVLKALHTF